MHRVLRSSLQRGVVVGSVFLGGARYNEPTVNEPLQDPNPAAMQWLWTIDGVQFHRDKTTGDTVFVDDATGERVERPPSAPTEAYARRWRYAQPWTSQEDTPPPRKSRVAKHVLLVRHAQYNTEGREDAQRTLTALGEQQCVHLAQRLRGIHDASSGFHKPASLTLLLSSELARAVQTADLIAPQLPDARRSREKTLNEGRPCLPEPQPSHAASYNNRNRDAERIERAYRMLCERPPPTQTEDSYEVVVCHANVIRYVVCRALQLPPEAWLRFSLPHASLTHLVVRANGHCSVRCLGDSGHLPVELVTS